MPRAGILLRPSGSACVSRRGRPCRGDARTLQIEQVEPLSALRCATLVGIRCTTLHVALLSTETRAEKNRNRTPHLMRKINTRVALVVGMPATVIAVFERANSVFTFGLTVLMCAAIVGIPQGYLASCQALRHGRWRLAALLPAMVLTGVVLTTVAQIAAIGLTNAEKVAIPTGRWTPVPPPPARITALLGPACSEGFSKTAYVTTEGDQAYQLRGGLTGSWTWTEIDAVPSGLRNARSHQDPARSGRRSVSDRASYDDGGL